MCMEPIATAYLDLVADLLGGEERHHERPESGVDKRRKEPRGVTSRAAVWCRVGCAAEGSELEARAARPDCAFETSRSTSTVEGAKGHH